MTDDSHYVDVSLQLTHRQYAVLLRALWGHGLMTVDGYDASTIARMVERAATEVKSS